MLKPGKTFNLSKSSKRILAQFPNAHERGQWKRMMIDAELSAAIVIKPEKKDRKPGGNYLTTSNSATVVE